MTLDVKISEIVNQYEDIGAEVERNKKKRGNDGGGSEYVVFLGVLYGFCFQMKSCFFLFYVVI